MDISLKSSSDIISSVSLLKNKTAQVTKLAQNTSTSNDTITVTNSKLNLVQVHQPLNIQSVSHPNHTAGTLQIVQNQLIALQSPKIECGGDKHGPEIKLVPMRNTTPILVNTGQGQQLLHINSNQLQGNDSLTKLLPVNQTAKSVDNSKAQPIQTGDVFLETQRSQNLKMIIES